MGTDYILRPWERELFLGCRRAWDFGAYERQGLESAAPPGLLDLEQAVKDALAVYYFPGMWDWNRAIVGPLATEGFAKALRTQRQAYEASTATALDAEGVARWEAASMAGRRLLDAYYGWAPGVDTWSPVQVETLFDVTVPDPDQPDLGLLTPDGRGVLYRLRVDLVVLDKAGRYWVVEHRLCPDGFAERDDLLLDDSALTRSWAWEQGFLSKVAGTIHNACRHPTSPGRRNRGSAAPGSGGTGTRSRGLVSGWRSRAASWPGPTSTATPRRSGRPVCRASSGSPAWPSCRGLIPGPS
jgi:hypothetical protein